jgi:hypothetical protein
MSSFIFLGESGRVVSGPVVEARLRVLEDVVRDLGGRGRGGTSVRYSTESISW